MDALLTAWKSIGAHPFMVRRAAVLARPETVPAGAVVPSKRLVEVEKILGQLNVETINALCRL